MRGYSKQDDSQKIVEHCDVGTLLLKKSRRVRRLSIVIRPDKGVVVNVPSSVPYEAAEAFVSQKLDWIRKAQQKVSLKKTVFDESTDFRTRFHKLRLIAEPRSNVRLKLSSEFMDVYYPSGAAVTNPSIQDAIRKAIEHTWRMEAEELLPARVKALAAKHGFVYKKVVIKANRSCWGSCTFDNVINLSLHLMRMPDLLVDYVILHELCHTVHKNHGKGFWALLDKLTDGKAKLLAKEAKQYTTRTI